MTLTDFDNCISSITPDHRITYTFDLKQVGEIRKALNAVYQKEYPRQRWIEEVKSLIKEEEKQNV